MGAGAEFDCRAFSKERNETMLLATFQSFVGDCLFGMFLVLGFYGLLAKKIVANPGARKAAGSTVMSLIAKWLK